MPRAVAPGQAEDRRRGGGPGRGRCRPGRCPPIVSTPPASAASSSSAVPGLVSSPCCGNATCSTRTRPSSRRTASRTASTPRRPTSGSMSVWLRTCVVPHATIRSSSATIRSTLGMPELRAPAPVVGDPILERVAGRVRHPRPAEQGLVEVAVGVHQPGEQEPPADVELLGAVRAVHRPDRRDPAVAHEHVGGAVVAPGAPAAQQQVGHVRPSGARRATASRGTRWPPATP